MLRMVLHDSDRPRRLARFLARVSDNASRACRLVDRRRVADVGMRPDRSWPASGWSSRRTLMPISTALLRCLSYRRVGEWPPRYMGDIVVCGGRHRVDIGNDAGSGRTPGD